MVSMSKIAFTISLAGVSHNVGAADLNPASKVVEKVKACAFNTVKGVASKAKETLVGGYQAVKIYQALQELKNDFKEQGWEAIQPMLVAIGNKWKAETEKEKKAKEMLSEFMKNLPKGSDKDYSNNLFISFVANKLTKVLTKDNVELEREIFSLFLVVPPIPSEDASAEIPKEKYLIQQLCKNIKQFVNQESESDDKEIIEILKGRILTDTTLIKDYFYDFETESELLQFQVPKFDSDFKLETSQCPLVDELITVVHNLNNLDEADQEQLVELVGKKVEQSPEFKEMMANMATNPEVYADTKENNTFFADITDGTLGEFFNDAMKFFNKESEFPEGLEQVQELMANLSENPEAMFKAMNEMLSGEFFDAEEESEKEFVDLEMLHERAEASKAKVELDAEKEFFDVPEESAEAVDADAEKPTKAGVANTMKTLARAFKTMQHIAI